MIGIKSAELGRIVLKFLGINFFATRIYAFFFKYSARPLDIRAAREALLNEAARAEISNPRCICQEIIGTVASEFTTR
jgi:hypothetical protein